MLVVLVRCSLFVECYILSFLVGGLLLIVVGLVVFVACLFVVACVLLVVCLGLCVVPCSLLVVCCCFFCSGVLCVASLFGVCGLLF